MTTALLLAVNESTTQASTSRAVVGVPVIFGGILVLGVVLGFMSNWLLDG